VAGAAVVVVGLTACGCQGGHEELSPAELAALLPPRTSTPLPPVEGGRGERAAPALAAEDGRAVARSQQPDGDAKPPLNLLDLAPERPVDLTEGEPAARIGATVNGQAILNEEVLAVAYPALTAARDLPEPDRTRRRAEVWNQALNQLIEREVVVQEATSRLLKNGGPKNLEKLKDAAKEAFEKQWLQPVMREKHLENEERLRAALKEQGLSLAMVRRQWERNFMYTEYLRSRVRSKVDEIGPRQVMEYYDKRPEEFRRPDSVEWQDLFIPEQGAAYPTRADAHRFAETLAERVRKGEDFAALAKDFGQGLSAYRNGEGDGHKRGEIKPPEAETILFQLHEGETAVVELESGFHVVRVVKREYAGPVEFDEKTQRQIKEKLTNDVAAQEMKQIVNKLRRAAVIEYAH
jgi:hypothetical protein